MTDNSFFEIAKEQSRIKTAIVAEYFDAWANIIMKVQDRRRNAPEGRLAYIDLFAGPGCYKDGTKSTPILILEKAIKNQSLANRLVTFFNEKDEENFNSLKNAINELPGINHLRFKPELYNKEVGEEIIKIFRDARLIPSFFFIDPWGYKGLSLELFKTALRDWGCDCVFFFNYNRIRMGLKNELVEDRLNALFGTARAKQLRDKLQAIPYSEHELTIVEEMCLAIREMGKRYILPFRFRSESGTRTSHHLIFVSKDFLGYDKMKQIMAKYSSESNQGVATFEFNPASTNQPFLFQFSRPLEDLESMLLDGMAGRNFSVKDLYEAHSVGTPYLIKHYRAVLKAMEIVGKIRVDRSATGARRGSFGEEARIYFPNKI